MSASKQKRSSSRTASLASNSRITTAEYPILVESGGDGSESSLKYDLYFLNSETELFYENMREFLNCKSRIRKPAIMSRF